jgi:hypothetical protein
MNKKSEILEILKQVYKQEAILKAHVFEWYSFAPEGRRSWV